MKKKMNRFIHSSISSEWATHIHKIIGFPLIYGVCVRWRAPSLTVLCSAPMVKFTCWWWLCVSHLPVSLLDRFIWSMEQFASFWLGVFFRLYIRHWNSQDSSKLDYIAKKIVHFVIKLMTNRFFFRCFIEDAKCILFFWAIELAKYCKNFCQELWEIYDIRFPLTEV